MKRAQTNVDFAISITIFIVALSFYFYTAAGKIIGSNVALRELKRETQCGGAAAILMGKLINPDMSINTNYYNAFVKDCPLSPPPNTVDWNKYEDFLKSIHGENITAYLRMDLFIVSSYLSPQPGNDKIKEGTISFNGTTYPVVMWEENGVVYANISGVGNWIKKGDVIDIFGGKYVVEDEYIEKKNVPDEDKGGYILLRKKDPIKQCGALPPSPTEEGRVSAITYRFFATYNGQIVRVDFICMD